MSTTVEEHGTQASAPGRKKQHAGPGRSILLSLLVPALAFAATLPTWIQAKVPSVLKDLDVAVSGKDAAPAVSALALVALAGVVGVRIAGPVLRAVVCAVVALAGAGITVAAATAILHPAQASLTDVGKATGTTGAQGSYEVTVWPWLTAVLGVAVLVTGILLWLSSRHWAVRGRRYERSGQAPFGGRRAHADDIDTWDSLSHGEDPTAAEGADAESGPAPEGQPS